MRIPLNKTARQHLMDRIGLYVDEEQISDMIPDMIQQSGEQNTAFVRVMDGEADDKTAEQLEIPAGTPLIRVARLITMADVPSVYRIDAVEKQRIRSSVSLNDYKLPIFRFLERFCGVTSELELTGMQAVKADAHLAETLQVPLGTPLLMMDVVGYDINGSPVFCAAEYYAGGIFCPAIRRKRRADSDTGKEQS